MLRLAPFVLLASVLLAALCRGQDFDLSDALGDNQATKKPTSPSKRQPVDNDDFNLDDAVLGEDDSKNPATAAPPPPRPNPGSHGNSGGTFSDQDLMGGDPLPENPGGGRASNPSKGGQGSDSNTSEKAEGSQGMLAGIISSVVVAIAGAVSSFIAYQKKKLCFKPSDQENVNMENQQGIHSEPPVQRTLLQKQ